MTDLFKQECKKYANQNRLGKIEYGDNKVISCSDYLQTLSIDEACIVNNNILGAVYSKKCKFTTLNNYELTDTIYNALIGVKYADSSEEYINMGKYTIQTPKNDKTAKIGEFEGLDDLSKLEEKYTCNITDFSNATIKDILEDLCAQSSIVLGTTTFTNEDIPITGNPFTNNETRLDVLKAILKVSLNFAYIDNNDNKLYLKWLDTTVTETLTKDDYTTLEKNNVYGPVNCLVLRMSNIEGENVTKQDNTSVSINGENQFIIEDDYFLITEELRTKYIDNLWNKIKGFTYVDCKITSYTGKPHLRVGSRISVQDNDGTYFETYVLKHNFKYDGTFYSVIESPALTKEVEKRKNLQTLKDFKKRTEAIVDKQNQQINLIAESQTEQGKKLASIEIEVDKVTTTVSETNQKVDDLGDSIEYFSVDLSQYSLTIPTGSDKKPLETKNYDVPFYAYYKGKQVTPNLTLSGNNAGITASKTNTYVRFAVNSSNAIANMLSQFTLTFSYTADGNTYTSTKKIDIALALKGADGIGEDGNGISNITRYYLATDIGSANTEVIEWTGDLTGKEQIDIYYRVSDKVFTEEQLIGQKFELTTGDGVIEMEIERCQGNDSYFLAYPPEATMGVISVVRQTTDDLPFPTGIYFLAHAMFGYVSKLTIVSGGVTTDTEGWTTEIQTIDSTNKYLWSYEVVTFDDGTTNTSEPVIIGVYGDRGIDGINGESAYIHIRYSANENGSSMTTAPTSDTKYMGVANTTAPTAPTSQSGYKWTKIKGEDGIGIDGEDGKTSYLHIKYSDDGVSFTPADEIYALGERPSAYIGQYVDYTEKDSDVFSDYEWYKFTENIDPALNDINNSINDMNNDIADNLSNIDKVVKRTNKLEETVNGLTNTLTTSGGGNLIKDSLGTINDGSWVGNVSSIRDSNTLSYSIAGVGIMLNSGIIEQTIQLPNAIHTISFNYKKTLSTVNAKLYINETIYDLSSVETILFEQQINVANNSLTIKFESDTDNGCYILDLMLNLGSAKQVWSQNANETSTDTVKIGKGIQVESSKMNTYFRADADGTRVINRTTGEPVREDTDKGTITNEFTSRGTSIVNGVLFTRVGNQVWESVV